MMNLDDMGAFEQIDSQDMIGQINRLPDQLADAWELGQSLSLPGFTGVRYVLVAGMGGSAIGADLLASYAALRCSVPVIVLRDYHLPAWANGPETLVITSSHSGNTEETLSVFDQARGRGCRVLAITTGGKLAEIAAAQGQPVWIFVHSGQPRAAVGYSFGLLLAAFTRLGLLPDPSMELKDALDAMRDQRESLKPETPVRFNPAKRMAGQLMGRTVAVFAADFLAPVARRWKGQLAELAKAWGQFEEIPEADHNTLAGLDNPESILIQTFALFLTAPSNHARNRLRLEYTRQIMMTQAVNTDVIEARGSSSLAHMWTLLHFGDYTAYYLAIAYGEDPTPVEAIEMLKSELRNTAD
jgi:glucose/mannose-6-phosphate isomerase